MAPPKVIDYFAHGLQDSGEPRIQETEDDYLQRALWFEGHAAKAMGVENITPQEVVAVAISRKPQWASSTWRQTKAALEFRYGGMNTPDANKAVAMLRAETQDGTLKRSKRTSALRRKNINPDEIRDLIAAIQRRRSKYAPVLAQWIRFGAMFGLRPHEWGGAQVDWLSQADIEGKGSPAHKKPYLRVENGKTTNGRSHGKYRHLEILEIEQETINEVSDFCLLMTSIHSSGEFQLYYQGCRTLLYRINQDFEDSQGRKIQLYSPRHHFSANSKKVLTLAETAALMGHGSDRTASLHYGRRAHSSSGVAVRPVSAEVLRVNKNKPPVPGYLSSAKKRRKSKRALKKAFANSSS